ncbi:MAG TPA: type I-C CRISPR-associated protein Cas8c/Csd1 [Ruminiclostridium sp.]|nr:type I-C CRISPR-associated protein Cas8c/Csd1 [Ruminiclostridium sp.]
MILQSLVEYYEILAEAGEISHPGYCMVNVSFALNLSQSGELLNVIPLKRSVQRGKKAAEIPISLEVPEQEKKTVGIKSNFLCENSGYVLGVDKKGRPERTKQCFEAFSALHHQILDGINSIPAKAVLAFIDGWEPEKAKECEALKNDYEEMVSGANIVFMIQGMGYTHQDAQIRAAWEQYRSQSESTTCMQCLVTGKTAPIARLHPNIKGVKDAQPMGVSLVSFNSAAYESYGHEQKDKTGQGLNAPVSEYAAFAYTTALNYLLADTAHKQTVGDTTVIYWAMSSEKKYRDLFAFSLNPTKKQTNSGEKMAVDKQSEGLLEDIFNKIVQGKPISENVEYAFDSSTRFYVLGLAPNAARLSVRFFMANTFGGMLEHIAKHYRDLEIEKAPNDFEYIPVWKLLEETVSSKVRVKKPSPLLSGEVMRSILSGSAYPESFLSNVLLRIRAEQDDEERHTYKISRGRAAIIKACLLRKNDNTDYKEVLTVSLNEDSNIPAYVLGRLFAVLEKAQQDANPGINSTIKDRYFTSACATPASVFPILLRLSNHHIAKSDYGSISERRISSLMEKLDVEKNPFPAHLSLNDQGIFILGYYHQQKANFKKTNKEDK